MSELERIEVLEKEIRELKGLNKEGDIETFLYSKISLKDLKKKERCIHKIIDKSAQQHNLKQKAQE